MFVKLWWLMMTLKRLIQSAFCTMLWETAVAVSAGSSTTGRAGLAKSSSTPGAKEMATASSHSTSVKQPARNTYSYSALPVRKFAMEIYIVIKAKQLVTTYQMKRTSAHRSAICLLMILWKGAVHVMPTSRHGPLTPALEDVNLTFMEVVARQRICSGQRAIVKTHVFRFQVIIMLFI